jgi:hypothetical protein
MLFADRDDGVRGREQGLTSAAPHPVLVRLGRARGELSPETDRCPSPLAPFESVSLPRSSRRIFGAPGVRPDARSRCAAIGGWTTARRATTATRSTAIACTNACLTARVRRRDRSVLGQTGEACDDGNASDERRRASRAARARSAATAWCKIGVEECDDGNVSSADACLTSCLLNVCGDGKVNADAISEDDAAHGEDLLNDGNACLTSCTTAAGADLLQALRRVGTASCRRSSARQCDDGNTDERPTTCTVGVQGTRLACGDGVIREGLRGVRRRQPDRHRRAVAPRCARLAVCGDGIVQLGRRGVRRRQRGLERRLLQRSDCTKECSIGTAASCRPT